MRIQMRGKNHLEKQQKKRVEYRNMTLNGDLLSDEKPSAKFPKETCKSLLYICCIKKKKSL